MIQKITQNNGKCEQKLLTSRQIFRYAVPARTVTKKALIIAQMLSIGGKGV